MVLHEYVASDDNITDINCVNKKNIEEFLFYIEQLFMFNIIWVNMFILLSLFMLKRN